MDKPVDLKHADGGPPQESHKTSQGYHKKLCGAHGKAYGFLLRELSL